MTRQANEHWEWGNPVHQLLAIIAESTHNGNVYMGKWNTKVRKDDLLKIPRPGDKKTSEKKLGGDAVPIGEMVVWLGDGWDELFN